jgi:hypothetical protein
VAPAAAPTQPSSDEEHIARLRDFFSDHRTDNVGRAEELFKKRGEKIWAELENRYPGITAEYTKVWYCVSYGCSRFLRVWC